METLYGRSHYYPPEYNGWERGTLALLRQETVGDIVAHSLDRGHVRPNIVAGDLDIACNTLEWHLNRLVVQDIVVKERDDRNYVDLTLTHPVETVHLLREVYPSLPERMVDRFSRLVERLLTE